MGERSEPRQHAREGRGREKENSRLLSRASRLATFHDISQMDSPSKAIGELATFRSLDVKYIHRKSRCEMLIGGDDISNDVTCFSTFVYIRARFRFAPLWRKSDSSVDGEPQGNWWFQRRSCELTFLFPPLRQNAPESLLAGYQNSNSGNHLKTE